MMTRGQLAKAGALKAIRHGEGTYDWREVVAAADDLAARLQAQSLHRSPYVHLFAHNHPKTLVAFLAILKADLVCVLLDPAMGTLEYQDIRQDCWPRAVVRFSPDSCSLGLSAEDVGFTPAPAESSPVEVGQDVCAVVYTAAEDGYAKGAQLTTRGLLTVAESLVDCMPVRAADTCCALIPYDHLYGFLTALLTPMLAGATTMVTDPRGLAGIGLVADELGRWGATQLYTVPVAYYFLARVEGIQNKLAGLEVCASGGAPLPLDIFDLYRERYGIEIREGYGLTEASPVCTVSPRGRARRGSAGQALPHCALSIRNESDQQLPPGRVGEVCIQGPHLMRGYINRPDATAHAMRAGWLHSGDLGFLDFDGYLHLTGLKKPMFLVGGRNVYPAEVERLLRRNPNVVQARLLGAPDPVVGHRLRGRVVLRKNDGTTRTEFRRWCSSRLSRFKLPALIDFATEADAG
jgi:long-chain acyl-CoA synthetase